MDQRALIWFGHVERMIEHRIYGLYCFDGSNKWRAGTVLTEVRLDGYCAGGLGKKRDDDGGWATICERYEAVESPGAYVDD